MSKLKCAVRGCDKPADVVTIETLATQYCADCYLKRWDLREQDQPLCVTVDIWLTRLCPQGPHKPHIGCWERVEEKKNAC
jgi:hypothetical protein